MRGLLFCPHLHFDIRWRDDLGGEGEQAILKSLAITNELVQKSAMFQAMGVATLKGEGADTMSKLNALAAGLTMKSDSGKEMSPEQKFSYVVSKTAEGRALYEQYNEEKRQLLKRV